MEFLCLLTLSASASESVLMVGNVMYRDAEVSRITPLVARIIHASGVATVSVLDFTEDQQRRYGFDPSAIVAERERLHAAKIATEKAAADRVRAEVEAAKAAGAARVAEAAERARWWARSVADAQERRRKELAALQARRPELEKKLSTLRKLIAEEKERELLRVSRAMRYAEVEEVMQASGLKRIERDRGRVTMAEFESWSDRLRSVAIALVPGVLPAEATLLGRCEQAATEAAGLLKELDGAFPAR